MMRSSALVALLLSTLLAACASDKDALANKNISQQGPLKVHPGLLGQPVPPELQPNPSPAAVAPAAIEEAATSAVEQDSAKQPATGSR